MKASKLVPVALMLWATPAAPSGPDPADVDYVGALSETRWAPHARVTTLLDVGVVQFGHTLEFDTEIRVLAVLSDDGLSGLGQIDSFLVVERRKEYVKRINVDSLPLVIEERLAHSYGHMLRVGSVFTDVFAPRLGRTEIEAVAWGWNASWDDSYGSAERSALITRVANALFWSAVTLSGKYVGSEHSSRFSSTGLMDWEPVVGADYGGLRSQLRYWADPDDSARVHTPDKGIAPLLILAQRQELPERLDSPHPSDAMQREVLKVVAAQREVLEAEARARSLLRQDSPFPCFLLAARYRAVRGPVGWEMKKPTARGVTYSRGAQPDLGPVPWEARPPNSRINQFTRDPFLKETKMVKVR